MKRIQPENVHGLAFVLQCGTNLGAL
jgi:hypothetical protein